MIGSLLRQVPEPRRLGLTPTTTMTAHKESLEHLLLLQQIDDDLLQDLKGHFKTVTYCPRKNAFAPILPDESHPSKEQLRQADVIFSFVIPPTLESYDVRLGSTMCYSSN